jgi:type IV pilus assembly protein PilM
MLWRKQKLLGLDIGNRAIKAALLTKTGKALRLESYLHFDLKYSTQPCGTEEEIAELLKALISGSGWESARVAACLHDRDVRLLNFHFPPVSDSEISQILANEVEFKTGEKLENLALDYLVSNLPAAEAGVDLHAFVARKESMAKQLALIEGAKLRPISLESSIQATIENLRFNDYLDPTGATVVVDIGDSHTTVAMVVAEELVQMNCGKVGTGGINQRLIENLACSFEDSEALKVSYLFEQGEVPSIAPGNKLIEEGYYQIIVHIHDTINYFKASYKNQPITGVVLTGGGAQKEGLAHAIGSSVSLPVITADPVRNLEIFAASDLASDPQLPTALPGLHTAIGLALRGA